MNSSIRKNKIQYLFLIGLLAACTTTATSNISHESAIKIINKGEICDQAKQVKSQEKVKGSTFSWACIKENRWTRKLVLTFGGYPIMCIVISYLDYKIIHAETRFSFLIASLLSYLDSLDAYAGIKYRVDALCQYIEKVATTAKQGEVKKLIRKSHAWNKTLKLSIYILVFFLEGAWFYQHDCTHHIAFSFFTLITLYLYHETHYRVEHLYSRPSLACDTRKGQKENKKVIKRKKHQSCNPGVEVAKKASALKKILARMVVTMLCIACSTERLFHGNDQESDQESDQENDYEGNLEDEAIKEDNPEKMQLYLKSAGGCVEMLCPSELVECPCVLKYLLENEDIDIDKQDSQGCTMLHHAVREGYDEMVKLLIKKGAGTGLINDNGKTAFALAEDLKHNKIVDYLEQAAIEARCKSYKLVVLFLDMEEDLPSQEVSEKFKDLVDQNTRENVYLCKIEQKEGDYLMKKYNIQKSPKVMIFKDGNLLQNTLSDFSHTPVDSLLNEIYDLLYEDDLRSGLPVIEDGLGNKDDLLSDRLLVRIFQRIISWLF